MAFFFTLRKKGGDYILLREIKCVLVEIKPISFKGDEGETINKYKYTFIDEDGDTQIGYLDYEAWTDKVVDSAVYDESKAITVGWAGSEFQGKITWRLNHKK